MTVCNSLLAIQCSVRGPRVNETRLLAQRVLPGQVVLHDADNPIRGYHKVGYPG